MYSCLRLAHSAAGAIFFLTEYDGSGQGFIYMYTGNGSQPKMLVGTCVLPVGDCIIYPVRRWFLQVCLRLVPLLSDGQRDLWSFCSVHGSVKAWGARPLFAECGENYHVSGL